MANDRFADRFHRVARPACRVGVPTSLTPAAVPAARAGHFLRVTCAAGREILRVPLATSVVIEFTRDVPAKTAEDDPR